jgi:hypothetical protein
MARSAIAPFSRLRSRVAAIDVDVGGKADLGSPERVIEVDELRVTIGQLLERVASPSSKRNDSPQTQLTSSERR